MKISEELKVLDDLLMDIHDRIQSGRCLTNKQQAQRATDFLKLIANKDKYLSKYEASRYVGVSRATFDRLVKEGRLPKGAKRAGWKEIGWKTSELDEYIDSL